MSTSMMCALLSVTPKAEAQTINDFQIWTALFLTGQLQPGDRGATVWFDTHARRSQVGTVLILRPGAGYAFTPWGSVWIGYAWTAGFVDETGARVDTQGVWEQLTFNYRGSPRFSLQSRTRFEQFWSDIGSGMFPRLRQLGRVNIRPSERVPVGVAIWDEVFFGLKSTGWADAGFFENRIFAGLAIFTANNTFHVEPGYMFLNITQGQTKLLNHVLVINLFVNFKVK